MQTQAAFYGATSCGMICSWSILTLYMGADFHKRLLSQPILTRPSWLPVNTLLFLNVYYLRICYAMPFIFLVATFFPTNMAAIVAVTMTVYHLTETSITHSHRDYATMYFTWVFAVLPLSYARGAALGIAVHFVAASGFAKLRMAGSSWTTAHTLYAILKWYGGMKVENNGPLSHACNRFMQKHPTILSLSLISTLLIECIVVPAAFVLPQNIRVWIVAVLLLMHFMIAITQYVHHLHFPCFLIPCF